MNETEIKSALDSINTGAQAAIREQIEAARSEWRKHYDELKGQGADVTEVRVMVDRAIKRLDSIEAESTRRAGAAEVGTKTLGQVFVENPAVRSCADSLRRVWTKTGANMAVPGGSFFPIDLGIDSEFKATITSSAVGSATPGILMAQRVEGIVQPGIRRVRVRDLMTRLTTTNNAIEWPKENAYTNAASPTAETISKPESSLTFTIDSTPVRTIAHWIPAARQVLQDFSGLRGYIDKRLLDGLKDVEDWELIAGDGTGQHLEGLVAQSTAYDTARNVSSDTYIDKLNHAASQIEDVNLNATGFVLHPRDWRAIQLIKEETGGANKGAYLLGGPASLATPTIWGLPVATTTAVQVGKFYCADFSRCIIWDRMDAEIAFSTEHADYFIRNMVAIRAEERLALTVDRADVSVYGSFA